jgi:nicotinamidase-related amidase
MAERVWDRFLTEQDKAHVGMKPPRSIGFGKRPALLSSISTAGSSATSRSRCLEAIKIGRQAAAWRLERDPHIQTLLRTAREARIPIIHVTGLGGAGVDEWSFRRSGGGKKSPEMLDRERRKFDIIDEVEPLPGEAVLKKLSPSAFWGNPARRAFEPARRRYGHRLWREHERCVRASVVDGTTYRFRMIVAEECVFDATRRATRSISSTLNQKYADVLPVADIVQYLRSWRAEQPAGA